MAKAADIRSGIRRELKRLQADNMSIYVDGPRDRVRLTHGRQQVYMPVAEAVSRLQSVNGDTSGPEAVLRSVAETN